MPYHLERAKTDLTPYVLIDEEKGYMKLEGESYHENVFEFFQEIRSWLSTYLKTDFDSFTFDCELKYFNSSTVKILLGMLLEMDAADNSGNITVNWITTRNNMIIIECGEDFEEDLENLTFNLIAN
ncbi:MAG: DUF1987 domain-containing protein [Defluviitaleaceae bacterium]|nr:DUF1987 domain-containing protein [Defluviitaleaceae bacterium]MCL2835435.1 DUF1987 domain-containing protein [Defluviitaleaceae bacterium]